MLTSDCLPIHCQAQCIIYQFDYHMVPFAFFNRYLSFIHGKGLFIPFALQWIQTLVMLQPRHLLTLSFLANLKNSCAIIAYHALGNMGEAPIDE